MPIELCLFDLDDTLVMTSDLEHHRGRENVNGGGRTCTGAIENDFQNNPYRHIYTPALLNELRTAYPDMKWGVFTRAPRVYAQTVLRLAYPTIKWDVVVAYEDVRRTKPYPDGIYHAMEQVGVEYIDRTMMVGDSKVDIMSAYHAGAWAALDQSSWPKKRVSDNWRCLELLADCEITSPNELASVLSDPPAFMPLLDSLAGLDEIPLFSDVLGRIDRINHFKPDQLGGGYTSIYCLGRMFSGYQSLANRAKWHALTEQILAHKDATNFPESWLYSCAEFLQREVVGRKGGPVVVTVIPAKPGRTRRLEAFLGQLEAYIEAHPIEEARIEFVPDTMAYGKGALSHHGAHLKKPQRFENVRDNLSVINAKAVHRKHVVVIDDVVTTGATLIYATTYLREAGAASVSCLAFAKAIGDG